MRLSKDEKTLEKIYSADIGKDGYFKVPDGVKTISSHVCGSTAAREKLKIIELNEVETIKCNALHSCKELESVLGLPKIVFEGAFAYCSMLKDFDFSNVVGLGYGTFLSSGIEKVDISNLERIPQFLFAQCNNLKEVIGSPKSVGACAFSHCENLEYFDFSNIEEMEREAFSKCGCVKIDETAKLVHIACSNHEWNFARIGESWRAYRINSTIDVNKNAYIDKHGSLFILDPSNGEKILYCDDKEKFLEFWKRKP